MDYSKLRPSITSESLEAKNCSAASSIGTNYAKQDGSVFQRLFDYYVIKAKDGFGLITIEATAVDPGGKTIANQLGLWSDEHIDGLRKLVDECHKYGAKVVVQLCHAGRGTNTFITGSQPVFASPGFCPQSLAIPHELATEEVYEIIQKFVDAARRCRNAGVDAVEVHTIQGYFIGTFLSPRSNKRIDEFGDNFEHRITFLLLIIQGMRQQLTDPYPIIVRTSGEEGSIGDLSITEISAIARCLEDAGVNAILVAAKPGYLNYVAKKIKNSVEIPVIIKFLLLPVADTLKLIAQGISSRMTRRTCFIRK